MESTDEPIIIKKNKNQNTTKYEFGKYKNLIIICLIIVLFCIIIWYYNLIPKFKIPMITCSEIEDDWILENEIDTFNNLQNKYLLQNQ